MPDQNSMSEHLAFQLIPVLKDIAHFKDAKTKQYLSCNEHTLASFGVRNERNVIGHTVQDIDSVMLPHWGDGYANRVNDLDDRVKTTKQTINHNEVTVTSNGQIRLQNLIKIPVISLNKTVLGIFTFTQNLTHTLDRDELYKLYKNRYNKDLAIVHFIRHLGLSKFFTIMPTNAELRVLLAGIIQDNYKSIANYLQCSTKTVDMHLSNLRSKIINGDLSQILVHARSSNSPLVV
jgi:DNA-binding CsgD family transcriptional regulator